MAPSFILQLSVDRILDQVPGTPAEQALVTTYPRVRIGDPGDYVAPVDNNPIAFQATVAQGVVPLSIGIWRHTSHKLIHGSIRQIDGIWYWRADDGSARVKLAPDNPCVTGLIPEGSLHYMNFCQTRIISPRVAPGEARVVNLTCDYDTHQIGGDAVGTAGSQIYVSPPVGDASSPACWFTINILDRFSFVRDVRPMFRVKDVDAMSYVFDLSSYADVKAHAADIYTAVAHPTPSFTMPCDGPWSLDWVETFKGWMDDGMKP